MANFNYHFDEKAMQKDTDYAENSGKVLKHSTEDGENNWRGMCYLITTAATDLAENVDTVGIIRKNDHDIVIIFRVERRIKTNHDIEKKKKI